MSVRGVIRNGKVELPAGVELPEGATVTLTVESPDGGGLPEWAREMVSLAKPRQWPEGYARNLDANLTTDQRDA
jgi:hypothetical protein